MWTRVRDDLTKPVGMIELSRVSGRVLGCTVKGGFDGDEKNFRHFDH